MIPIMKGLREVLKSLRNASLIESVVLRNVLISGFTSGEGLKLDSRNEGGLGYCSFYDIGVRHAKIGILIREDETSFANSNTFFHGFVSGGGFKHCLLVQGGNNNVFNSMIFEPYSSEGGHLVVENGEVTGNDIRIEGIQQPTTVPLVKFESGTSNSMISGLYSGGLTVDEGDNFINFRSGKSLDPKHSGENLFVNACFNGVADNKIPFWEIQGGSVTVSKESAEYMDGHQVVKNYPSSRVFWLFTP